MKQLPAPRRTIDRRIVGTPEHVRNTIRLAQASGRLVHVSPWQETREGIQVVVRLIERPTAPTPAPKRRRAAVVGAAAGTAVTVVGVAGYALVRLVDAVLAALPVIGGAILLLALAALITRGRSRTFTFTGTGRMD